MGTGPFSDNIEMIEIRPIVPDELATYMSTIRRVFGGPAPTEEEIDRTRRRLEFGRTLAAFEGTALVATSSIESLELAVPGALLRAAGVTRVTVQPTHRRRGLMTAIMRRHLDDVHAAGEPLAAFFASQAPIYGRFGYGPASYEAHLEIDPGDSAFVRPFEHGGRITLVDCERALELFPPIWDQARRGQAGMIDIPSSGWEVRLSDSERRRPQGATANYHAVYEAGGKFLGYATYRIKSHPTERRLGERTLLLSELIALTPAAYGALWRYALDVDLMDRLAAPGRRVDEPLRLMLSDPRALQVSTHDGLWLRLIDVPKALSGRRYASEGKVVFEVLDTFCPWNVGRYELESGMEGAACRRSRAKADLVLDAADLAAAYLGGNRFWDLYRAGRVVEEESGALKRADGMFAWDPLPWSPIWF